MENTFVIIATFQYSSEAHIIRGKLESEGIRVFMADDITIDTDPLMSNAIGGVKLKVAKNQELEAKEVLKSVYRYSLDDKGEPVRCSKCESEKVDFFSTIKNLKSLITYLLGLVFFTLPFYTKYKYRCQNCNHEF